MGVIHSMYHWSLSQVSDHSFVLTFRCTRVEDFWESVHAH